MQSAECGKTVDKTPRAHFLYPWKGLINVLTLVKSNILGYNLIRSLLCANLLHLSTSNFINARHAVTTQLVQLGSCWSDIVLIYIIF